MRRTLFALTLIGCGPGNDDGAPGTGDGGEGGGASVDEGDGPSSSDSGENNTSAGESGGGGSGAGEFIVLAWVEADQSLELRAANHDAATCADPDASPPYDASNCDLEQDIWRISVFLEAPFEVPGDYETAAPGPTAPSSPLSASLSGTTAEDCDHGSIFGIQAALTLDSMSATEVAGAIELDDPRFPRISFAVPICP